MSKPKLEEVKELLKLKEGLKILIEEIAVKTRAIITEHGEGRFDYESTDPDDETKKFMKLVVKDELQALINGEDVGRFVFCKKESSLVSYLKGKPKGL